MTDTQQNLIQKKIDFKFYYKLAEEAAQAYDIDQALKISQNGLKLSQVHNKAGWVEKFDYFSSQLCYLSPDQNSLTPSIVKEDFTIIKGVGPDVAKKLNEGNIKSIKMLAKTTPKSLASSITGIGVATAQKIVNGARDYLSLNTLNNFSQSEEDSNDKQIHEEINENLRYQDLKRLTDKITSEFGYQKSANKEYIHAKHRFWLIIRNLGFLLLLYSLVLIFVIIFLQYSILTLFINLGFVLIGFLSIIIGYVYLKFHIIKINLK